MEILKNMADDYIHYDPTTSNRPTPSGWDLAHRTRRFLMDLEDIMDNSINGDTSGVSLRDILECAE